MTNSHNIVFASRVFSISDACLDQPEWYCLTREDILGPYENEQAANHALGEFLAFCKAIGWNGDRDVAANEASISRCTTAEAA